MNLDVLAALAILLAPAPLGPAVDLARARLVAAEAEPAKRTEHLETAAAALETALAGSEESYRARGEALVLLARARMGLNRRAAAEAAAAEAIALDPNAPPWLAVAGSIALERGDPKTAADRLERAVLGPDPRAEWVRDLARAELRSGSSEMALVPLTTFYAALTSADGLSLFDWCSRRMETNLGRRHEAPAGPGFRVISELGPEVARRAAARIAALAPEYSRRFPLPPGAPVRQVPVYVLSEKTFARLAPSGAPARAFYQRDEQAVFAIGEKPPELERLLAHECFHAHLHRLLEDPPAWLDEGTADWFAGLPGPQPIRLRDLQCAFDAGREVRFAELALCDRRRMYEGDGVYLRFAAAWGYVHYFRARAPERLDRYVARLLAGASSEEAFAAAFGDADIVGIESLMRAHVMALREGVSGTGE